MKYFFLLFLGYMKIFGSKDLNVNSLKDKLEEIKNDFFIELNLNLDITY